MDIVQRGRTGRDDDRLAHRGDECEFLEPVHVARADLVSVDVGVEVRDGLDVVGGRHELDADVSAVLGEDRGPLPRQ